MNAVLSFRQTTLLPPQAPPRQGILRDEDLVDLYRGIETALPGKDSRIVQLISCYPGEGATTIGSELAMFATQTLGCRALHVDLRAAASSGGEGRQPAASLLDVVRGAASMEDAVVESIPGSLWKARLVSGHETESLLPHLDELKTFVLPLRNRFKLILFSTPGALIDSTIITLGRLADAAVLVVEAERTRAPVARQVLRTLEGEGTRLIGVAFNKRRYHIPDRFYRLL